MCAGTLADGPGFRAMYKSEQQTGYARVRLENMQDEETSCPLCKAPDTIRTEATLARDTRYCFGCRQSFDVVSASPPEERHRAGDRSGASHVHRRRT